MIAAVGNSSRTRTTSGVVVPGSSTMSYSPPLRRADAGDVKRKAPRARTGSSARYSRKSRATATRR